MPVKLSYGLVIVIWATTPLAIKLGGETLSPIAGLSLRIGLAFAVGCAISTLAGQAGLNLRGHWRVYLAASLSLFPNMMLVYSAARYLPSGLISLMFGLSPFVTAVLAWPILGERPRVRKLLAISIAGLGLVCLLLEDGGLRGGGHYGILLMLASNVIFSASALWVKRLSGNLAVSPLQQSLGAMAFALPGMLLYWYVLFGFEAPQFSVVSFSSLVYLAVFGSLVGFVAYYHILRCLPVETVSLIPLLTPVLAVSLGVIFAGERISVAMLAGGSLIIAGLALHRGRG